MTALARILDANANRAREALRVMEDIARFALDDSTQSSELKHLRHDLHSILQHLPDGWLLTGRDTPGDVGTTVETEGETRRHGLHDVAAAAGKRAGEALRSLEELLKLQNENAAARIKALRYRMYAAESSLVLALGAGRAKQWRVCVLVSEELCAQPWEDVVRASFDGGADCVQIREKTMDGGMLAARVTAALKLAQPYNASVIVNDRADVALAAGAHGVHLGRDDLPIASVRQLAGRTLLIGASTHSLDEAAAAVAGGADYCGVGAMFQSPLKPTRPPAGVGYLREFLSQHPNTPHLAIGGITLDTLDELVQAGARGVAVSSAVCQTENPAAIVRAMRDRIDAAWSDG